MSTKRPMSSSASKTLGSIRWRSSIPSGHVPRAMWATFSSQRLVRSSGSDRTSAVSSGIARSTASVSLCTPPSLIGRMQESALWFRAQFRVSAERSHVTANSEVIWRRFAESLRFSVCRSALCSSWNDAAASSSRPLFS